MKSNNYKLYFALTWVATVLVAYGVGWWTGVKSVTHVAAGAARSGMSLVWIFAVVIAAAVGFAAFRMRGFLDHHDHTTTA
jgi:hypothetical protein